MPQHALPGETSRTPAGDAKIVALIAAAVALIFSDVLFRGSGFYVRDVLNYYLPSRFVFRRIVLGGELPLWNPWFSGGQPFAANPGFQVFYPGTWLTLLPDFFWGFHVAVVAHVALAAAGMFALLRTLALGRPAALFGATAFALGGAVLSLTNLLILLHAAAWWPLIALFEIRVLRGGRTRDAALLALSLAMLFLAAEQSMMIQAAILVASIALAERAKLRGLCALAVAGAIAVAIASVQLVPALDLKRASPRAHGFSEEEAAGAWSMPLDRPLELVWAHAFGRITDDGLEYHGRTRYDPPRVPAIFSIYCGLAVPLLFVGGMFTRTRWRWWAAALAVLSYALAIGGHGPLVPWLYDIGVWRTIRFPEKFVLFGVFAMIVFASIALDRLGPRIAFVVLVATLGDLSLHISELAPRMPRRYFTEVPPNIQAMSGDARVFFAGARPPPRAPQSYWAQRDALAPFIPALYGKRLIGEIDLTQTNLPPATKFFESLQGAPDLEARLAAANVEWVVLPWGVKRIGPRPRYELDGEVSKLIERTNEIDLEVRARSATLLHLRFTPDPHWRATVDDEPVPLRVVDIGFAGVDVPAGDHHVALRYRDPLIAGCGALSLLALAGTLFAAARGSRAGAPISPEGSAPTTRR